MHDKVNWSLRRKEFTTRCYGHNVNNFLNVKKHNLIFIFAKFIFLLSPGLILQVLMKLKSSWKKLLCCHYWCQITSLESDGHGRSELELLKLIQTLPVLIQDTKLLMADPSPQIHFPYRVLKLWHHKNDFSEIMGFIRLFRTTYLKKVHMQKLAL